MFFMPQRTASLSPQGQRGGCGIKKRGGVAAPHSLNSFVSCVLPLLFGFENDDPEKFEETIATPPKRGVPTDPDSGALWHASIPARRGSLSSVFIPAGRLGKDPQEGALKEGRRTYEMAVAPNSSLNLPAAILETDMTVDRHDCHLTKGATN